jgi:hypothetical protein
MVQPFTWPCSRLLGPLDGNPAGWAMSFPAGRKTWEWRSRAAWVFAPTSALRARMKGAPCFLDGLGRATARATAGPSTALGMTGFFLGGVGLLSGGSAAGSSFFPTLRAKSARRMGHPQCDLGKKRWAARRMNRKAKSRLLPQAFPKNPVNE